MKVTEKSYHEAAISHIDVAQSLLDQKQFVLASYIAGLSVECMLRAYAHRVSNTFNEKHNLEVWLKKSRFDAVVPHDRQNDISAALGLIVSQWSNSQRYYSVELLRSEWHSAELDRGIKGDPVKELTQRLVDAALEIVTLGEEQWKNSLKRSQNS